MYKIAVLGDRDSIYGFGALGLDVFPVDSPEEGAKALRRLAEEGYAVLYVTEALCAQIVSGHRSTTVDNRAYLLIFNNYLPKQHFRI